MDRREDAFLGRFVPVNRLLNRPAASLLVRAVHGTRITPDQLTYTAFAIGLAAAACFAEGSRTVVIIGALLTQLSSIVDCADGMLARARHTSSARGATLDLLCDRVNEFFLLAGIAAGFGRTGRPGLAMLGLLALGLYFLETTVFYVVQHAVGAAMGETGEMRALLLLAMCLFGLAGRLDAGIALLAVFASVAITCLAVGFLRSPQVGTERAVAGTAREEA
jgi:phosphatidylglycerophosphate synthase